MRNGLLTASPANYPLTLALSHKGRGSHCHPSPSMGPVVSEAEPEDRGKGEATALVSALQCEAPRRVKSGRFTCGQWVNGYGCGSELFSSGFVSPSACVALSPSEGAGSVVLGIESSLAGSRSSADSTGIVVSFPCTGSLAGGILPLGGSESPGSDWMGGLEKGLSFVGPGTEVISPLSGSGPPSGKPLMMRDGDAPGSTAGWFGSEDCVPGVSSLACGSEGPPSGAAGLAEVKARVCASITCRDSGAFS